MGRGDINGQVISCTFLSSLAAQHAYGQIGPTSDDHGPGKDNCLLSDLSRMVVSPIQRMSWPTTRPEHCRRAFGASVPIPVCGNDQSAPGFHSTAPIGAILPNIKRVNISVA